MAEKPKADQMLANIVNRQPFSYDAKADPLYQAYSQEYQALGEKAKADTLRDVGILGGSSIVGDYAKIAAQQAQNTYRQQMSTIIPALEEAAYGRWKGRMQKAQSDYGLLRDEENALYGRQMDTVADNQFKSQADWQRSAWNKDFNYGKRRDQIANSQWKKEFGWLKTTDNREYELKKRQLEKQKSSGGGIRRSGGGSAGGGYVARSSGTSGGENSDGGVNIDHVIDQANAKNKSKGKKKPPKSDSVNKGAIETALTDGLLGLSLKYGKKRK